MSTSDLPAPITPPARLLTAADFQRLAEVSPEIEWFANLGNPSTRRVYENALQDFMRFTGIVRPEEFRAVTRAHVIAWRADLHADANCCEGARHECTTSDRSATRGDPVNRLAHMSGVHDRDCADRGRADTIENFDPITRWRRSARDRKGSLHRLRRQS